MLGYPGIWWAITVLTPHLLCQHLPLTRDFRVNVKTYTLGSGTVLYAAALRGLRAVGCDLNPTAVAGARDNLAFAARGAGAALPRGACAPGVHLHDCTLPVHAPRSCVRSRHPR